MRVQFTSRGMSQKKIISTPNLEEIFSIQIRAVKLPEAKRQYKFHPSRQWQFDFSWPQAKIAVEIDGGTYLRGRHVQPEGFRKDCQKINAAQLLGWTVFRGDTRMVKDGSLLDTVMAAFRQNENRGEG